MFGRGDEAFVRLKTSDLVKRKGTRPSTAFESGMMFLSITQPQVFNLARTGLSQYILHFPSSRSITGQSVECHETFLYAVFLSYPSSSMLLVLSVYQYCKVAARIRSIDGIISQKLKSSQDFEVHERGLRKGECRSEHNFITVM